MPTGTELIAEFLAGDDFIQSMRENKKADERRKKENFEKATVQNGEKHPSKPKSNDKSTNVVFSNNVNDYVTQSMTSSTDC